MNIETDFNIRISIFRSSSVEEKSKINCTKFVIKTPMKISEYLNTKQKKYCPNFSFNAFSKVEYRQ